MQRRFHARAGAAGALICGFAATLWCAFAPPPFAAGALVAIENDARAPAAYDTAALGTLATSDAVLRKAALAPAAASAIAQAARPGPLSPLLGLVAGQSGHADTLSRAADLLAARIEVEPAQSARGVRILARMEDPAAAARVADAVAQAVAAAHNEAAARIDRRLDQSRGERLAEAERRREAARARLAALRAHDMTPTASIHPPAQSTAQPALAEAQRAAVAAGTKRAEAARIYGPRHPQMIQIETEAKRAQSALQAALQVARAKPPPAPRLAEGGPDPRGPELAEAEIEFERAEAAYDREAARFAAPEREAQVVEPAKALTGTHMPASLTIAASALLGFLLFGAAPGLGAGGGSAPARPHARLRRGALDEADAQTIVDALNIAGSEGARRVLVAGDALPRRDGALALAQAAMAAGWRPLLVGNAGADYATPRGPIALDGRIFSTGACTTPEGELVVARPAPSRRAAPDADLAFDLAIFDGADLAARIDVVVWIGATPPDRRLPRAAAGLLWIEPAQTSRAR